MLNKIIVVLMLSREFIFPNFFFTNFKSLDKKLIVIIPGWGWVEWVILVAGILGKNLSLNFFLAS